MTARCMPCILCDEEDELDNLQQVKQTGLKTLKRLAKERKLENLSRFLFDLQFANLDLGGDRLPFKQLSFFEFCEQI